MVEMSKEEAEIKQEIYLDARKEAITFMDKLKCFIGVHRWQLHGRLPNMERDCAICFKSQKGVYQSFWGETKWINNK